VEICAICGKKNINIMSIQAFLEKVKQTPNEITFPETIAVI